MTSRAETVGTTEYVDRVDSWDSGGGVTLDLIHLKDGTVLAISAETVALYPNLEALASGEAEDVISLFRPTA